MNTEEFEKVVLEQYEEAVKNTANQIGREIRKDYIDSIQAFYDDYTPKRYIRTWNTYLASNAAKDARKSVQKKGKAYICGISVSSSFMKDAYRADTDWVFERTYAKGIHGFTSDYINRVRNWYKDPRGSDTAKPNKWVHAWGTYGNINVKAPRKMVPPPNKLMNDKFKKYNESYIFDVFVNYL